MPGAVGKRIGESKMNEIRKTSEVLLESPGSLGAQAREKDAERIGQMGRRESAGKGQD